MVDKGFLADMISIMNTILNSIKKSLLLLLLLCTFICQNGFSQQTFSEVTDSQMYMQILNNVFAFVERNYVDSVDPKVLYEGALKGMLEALEDPYTTYLDKKSLSSLTDTTEGAFGGVGLQITKKIVSTPEEPAYVEVVSPIEDTPGWKAGIQPGDKITKINDISTPEISMDEVLAMLRGPVKEVVKVSILRGASLEFSVSLVRDIIEVPTVKYGLIETENSSDKIGYLRIIEFTPYTPEKTKEAINSFKKNKCNGMIIDLRNNPGGLISSVVSVADLFIDSGTIVSTKSRISSENQTFSALRKNTIVSKDLPIVVLINQGSASASEILSGALKDHKRAYLVGEKTYGKGSVQQVRGLYDQDGMKLTIARYYTPSDANIDKTGIPPDREILFPKLSEEEEKTLASLLNSTVIQDLVKQNPKMNKTQISKQAKILSVKYPIEERMLRKLIANEVYRTTISPLYDLDYDIQLKEAQKIILTEDVSKLLMSVPTVKELQEKNATINSGN